MNTRCDPYLKFLPKPTFIPHPDIEEWETAVRTLGIKDYVKREKDILLLSTISEKLL
jgi:hypothetical protein